jgi:hypothetical protein
VRHSSQLNWEATASGRGFFSIALFSEFVATSQSFRNSSSVASPIGSSEPRSGDSGSPAGSLLKKKAAYNPLPQLVLGCQLTLEASRSQIKIKPAARSGKLDLSNTKRSKIGAS